MNSTPSPDSNPEETEIKSPFSYLSAERENISGGGSEQHETIWHSALEPFIPPEAPKEWKIDVKFPDEELGKGYGDTCAVRCQEVILHQYGIDIKENTLVHEAMAKGWYYPGQATLPEDVGKLLEYHGIHVHQYQHANVFNLTTELAQGHMVMIGVNSNELHHPILEDIANVLHIDTADHAVIVSGIDTHDPDHIQVIVSDPDTGEAAAHYPLESFVNAWEGSDFFVTATDEPLPLERNPEMEHFNYDNGHIEEVAGIPYDEFESFADSPGDVEHILETYLESHEDSNLSYADNVNNDSSAHALIHNDHVIDDSNVADDNALIHDDDTVYDFSPDESDDMTDAHDIDDAGDIGF